MPLSTGTHLEPYGIHTPIGAGGIGEVSRRSGGANNGQLGGLPQSKLNRVGNYYVSGIPALNFTAKLCQSAMTSGVR